METGVLERRVKPLIVDYTLGFGIGMLAGGLFAGGFALFFVLFCLISGDPIIVPLVIGAVCLLVSVYGVCRIVKSSGQKKHDDSLKARGVRLTGIVAKEIVSQRRRNRGIIQAECRVTDAETGEERIFLSRKVYISRRIDGMTVDVYTDGGEYYVDLTSLRDEQCQGTTSLR